MNEKNYDFRKRLLQIHKPVSVNVHKSCENHFTLSSPVRIYLSDWNDEVMSTAVVDFIDFFKTAFGIKAIPTENREEAHIKIGIASDDEVDLGEYTVYRGFMVNTDETSVVVSGHDARGAAQALYYLEDVMEFEAAPAIPYGNVSKKPMFSPQMIHSGYGQDEYPDNYLARVAHEGRDAILIFVEDLNKTSTGPLDFNSLIHRAARYGLDVYAYSRILSEKHPEDSDAEEYYDGTYGRLFRECPGLKGVILVGESIEFPSNDPHVHKGRYYENKVDGIPIGKLSAGWYPCEDYPLWISMVRKVIRKYNKDADIVFWSYNWSSQPDELKNSIIAQMPKDIALEVTFDNGGYVNIEDYACKCDDYTLSFAGPSDTFKNQAVAAKKQERKLYSMTNTGGLTWDVGVIPYEPMPFQWMKRYDAMRKAHKEWGLCGIMECHHFGFYPSFISKLAKWCFWSPEEDMEAVLKKILVAEYGEENIDAALSALKSWSEAITHYTPTDPDQWGAFRVGPAYPIAFSDAPKIPDEKDAPFGSGICVTQYGCFGSIVGGKPVLNIMVQKELGSLRKMLAHIENGIKSLENAPVQNPEIDRLLNLGRFIKNTVITGVHAKEFFILKNEMIAETSKERLEETFHKMIKILENERENVVDTIPLVEKDSRLGWEPSMLYMTDRWHLEWKLRHLEYVLQYEADAYRKVF